ncbi:kinase-like domain-containing protein [Morchella snyderi]|nr:kinase-like domain-containing protein [Morchella snyderi]
MDCIKDIFQEGSLLDGRFESIKLLNHGSFGMVYLAKDVYTNELVAIKCLAKANTGAEGAGLAIDELSQELEYHTQIGSHPNIVNLAHSFETETHVFLALEYCPMGDLYETICSGCGPLETEHVREFMLQLVSAVEHMHSRGVYHRDIKPENIFLSASGSVKLGDFGLATMEQWTDESAVGSDRYMAPEQYDSFGGYSPEQADIWAIGICLLNILFARNPFTVPSESDPLFADYVLDRESLFDIFPTMSYDTFEVLINCLSLDPNKRSLKGVREALERAVCWTTDEESLDDFCTEDRDVVVASANREPLRTPSIPSPQVAQGGSFPWAQALHSTPMARQLSVIPDQEEPMVRYSEDMFVNSPDRYAHDMGFYVPPTPSFDSGLGGSFSSMEQRFNLREDKMRESRVRTETIPIQTSAVAKTENALGMTFGKPEETISKSWSDWVIEDEEEEEREREEREKELKRRSWSYESDQGYDDDGYDAEWVGGGWEDLTV